MTDLYIRDQAYQFFKQEAVELLQIIEEGLLTLQEEYDTPHIHQLMRAAHSIKGGAASVDLPGIQKIAHKLEDIFRALYQCKEPVDDDVEEALLQACDSLRNPLLEQFETGSFDAEAAWSNAEPIFAVLEEVLQAELANTDVALPTAAELGVDLVYEVFSSDVLDGIERVKQSLADPDSHEVAGEIRSTAEVFQGLGDLLTLTGFSAIAQTTIQALDQNPQDAQAIGQAALASWQAAYESVVAGDRTEGGHPNETLLSLSQGNMDVPDPTPELDNNALQNLNNFFGQGTLDADTLMSSDMNGIEPSIITPDSEVTLEEESSLDLAMPSLGDVFGQVDLSLPPEKTTAEGGSDGEILDDLPLPSLGDVFGQPTPEIVLEQENTLGRSGDNAPVDPMSDIPVTDQATSLPISDSVVLGGESQPSLENAVPAESSGKVKEVETAHVGESVRVDFTRLDRLNNLVGELVTQENGALLHNQQLQSQVKRLKQRFSHFEQLSQTFQSWMDQSVQSDIQVRNLQTPTQPQDIAQDLSDLADLDAFDPLQMDSYSSVYTTLQSALDEISQMEEQLGDITLITQAAQRIQRQKQQTLKQVRNDLLWARMIPLQDILKRFPRMVRDMSSKFDKRVKFRQVGAATLIDKAILERLYDPLVHLIRNAFDHGIESPDLRVAQGKKAQALIEVRAYHRGNQTFIEVRDDGRGIDPEKLRRTAIEKAMMSEDEAQKLTLPDLHQLLFAPNFSTAQDVSELSGRGMGMNAVQSQVRALKGSIKIDSELGQGTIFTISLPLTLTIAKLLVFRIDGRTMAIPVDSLQGIISADDTEMTTIQGRLFYRDDEDLIPLYPSSAFLHHYPLPKQLSENTLNVSIAQENKTPILLISSGAEIIALEVDSVATEQELVIKPFGRSVAPPPYLYGCAILGDGSLAPVIDAEAIVQKWQVIQDAPVESAAMAPVAYELETGRSQRSVLVIDDSLTTRRNVTLTLQKFGYQVLQAGDGREALEVLRQHPQIKVVVSDVEMPNMNGFEFLSACRKQHSKEQLPVIMLTSRSGDKHQKIAHVLGANFYLTKPYLEQDLRNTLDRCLEAVSC